MKVKNLAHERQFGVRVGRARPAGEIRIGDAPQPRQLGHVLDPALEKGNAIGSWLALRKGAPPGDARLVHCR